MFRSAAVALICLAAVPALAQNSPAAKETRDQRAERCGIQAGIVEAAIEHRTKKRSQKRATRKVLKSDPIKGTKYEANVDVLVAWIYTLPDGHLNADTISTFEQACLKFDG